jgi:hypothetical protein
MRKKKRGGGRVCGKGQSRGFKVKKIKRRSECGNGEAFLPWSQGTARSWCCLRRSESRSRRRGGRSSGKSWRKWRWW